MASPVKVAAIGLGWVAQHRHLPVMDRSPRFAVVGVMALYPAQPATAFWRAIEIGALARRGLPAGLGLGAASCLLVEGRRA